MLLNEKEERDSLLTASSTDDEPDYGNKVNWADGSTGNKRAKLIRRICGRRVSEITFKEVYGHLAALREIALVSGKPRPFREQLLDRLAEHHPLIQSFRPLDAHTLYKLMCAVNYFFDHKADELKSMLGDEEFAKIKAKSDAQHEQEIVMRNQLIAELSVCAPEEVVLKEKGFFSRLFRC